MGVRRAATHDFPFADLSAEDFHRLVLHLLDRDDEVRRVENYGAKGDDGGVDLIAVAPDLRAQAGGRSARVLVQVKRVREFTVSSARAELAALRRSGAHEGFERYLLVTSCVPTARAIEKLRKGCADLGIDEVVVWEASLLTAKLLANRDLLEFFFGIADANSWLQDPGVAGRYVEARRLIAQGHPLILVVGSRPEFDLAGSVLSGDDTPGDSLRWLVRNSVIPVVVAHGADLSLALGDLLEPTDTESPPAAGLWQPPATVSLGSAVATLLRSRPAGRKPVLAALGCDEAQVQSLRDEASAIEAGIAGSGTLTFATPVAGAQAPFAESASGQTFLRSVHELVARDWLSLHLVKVDFNQPYGFEDVLAGRPVNAGIARSGLWAREAEDAPVQSKPWVIEDLPGTGKTARGFRIGFRLCPRSTYYLDLATLPGVSTADLGRLLFELERARRRSVLLLDNAQFAKDTTQRFLDLVQRRGTGDVLVVVMLTKPFTSLELLGGVDRYDIVHDQQWKTRRTALASWCSEHLDAETSHLLEANREATNMWHFFYLMRGGAETLSTGLDGARQDDLADVVWFMISAQIAFFRRSATVRNVYAGLDQCELWPLTVNADGRGRWLLGRIDALLASQRVVPVGDGFACRHQYEAFAVLRLCFDRDGHLTPRSFREAGVRMFGEALPRIKIPEPLRQDPERLEKYEVRSFARREVNDLLDRQSELEQALSEDPGLQEVVNEAWSELVELVETWPVHPLYWLFGSTFSFNLLRYSPFGALRSIPALQSVASENDAIDIEYIVKGLLAYDALPMIRYQMELPRFKESIEAHLELMDEISEKARRHLRDLPDPDPAQRRHLELVAGKADELREDLAEVNQVEARPLLLPFKVDQSEELRWTLTHSTMWLEHHTRWFQDLAAGIDRGRLLDSMDNLIATRPLLLAQLWLLSPELGRDLYMAMPPAWREEVISRVKESPESFTALHLGDGHDFLAVFVAELADVAPEIAAWLAEGETGVIGERLGTSPASGRRDGRLLDPRKQRPGELRSG